MKPIKLSFSGLNSFIKPQEIDFTQLTNGVFGIFGKTGSGKTTILDAIMLALYGQISKSTKVVDFINSKSEETWVELVFETGESNKKQYFIERRYRKKQKGNIMSSANIGEVVNGNRIVLADGTRDVDNVIKDIIGLSYNEFSKCIALPQGEFAGFLNATNSERTDIICNIFSLQEYGDIMYEKVKAKHNEFETKRQVLEAQKSMLKSVTKAEIEETERVLEENQNEVKNLIQERDKKSEIYQEQKKVKSLIERKNLILNELDSEYKRKGEIQEKSALCEKQRRALTISTDIKNLEELTKVTKSLKEEVIENAKQKNEAVNEYSEFMSSIEHFDKEYQSNLISLTKKEAELTSAVEEEMVVLSLKNQIELLKENLDEENEKFLKASEIFNKSSEELNTLKEKKEKLAEKLEELEKNENIDLTIKEIKDIESEIIIYENLEKQLSKVIDEEKQELELAQIEYAKLVKQENEINKKLETLGVKVDDVLFGGFEENFNVLKESQESLLKVISSEHQIDFINEMIAQRKLLIENKKQRIIVLENDEIAFNTKLSAVKKDLMIARNQGLDLSELKSQRYELEIKLSEIKTEQKFIKDLINNEQNEVNKLNFAKDRIYLKHVNNNSQKDENLKILKTEIEEKIEKIKQLFDLQEKERRYLFEIEKKKAETGTIIALKKENQEKLIDMLFGLQKYRAEHELIIYNAKERLKDNNISLENNLDVKKETENEFKDILEKLAEKTQNTYENEKNVVILENNLTAIRLKVDNVNLQIKEKEENYKPLIKEGLTASQMLNNVRDEIVNITSLYDRYNVKKEQLKLEVDKKSQTYKINASLLDEKVKTLSDLSFDLSGRVFSLGFKDIDDAKNYIIEENKIIMLQDEVNNYKQNIVLKEKELEVIKEELGDKTILDKEYELLEKEIEDLTVKISESNILIGTLLNSITQMKNDYESLIRIQNELPKVIKVLDDAKELLNLLRGKALVEFIAEEYMEVITKNASDKLNMLMGGRYELAFIDQDFVVYDNFNDHKARVVKTLSGGETFLVSLALALAISETISYSSNKNMEFFFLDEGFGTLDAELIDSVISALYKLESHNLNIGLISHVKELEEEIKNKIIVTKATEQEGSSVKIVHNL